MRQSSIRSSTWAIKIRKVLYWGRRIPLFRSTWYLLFKRIRNRSICNFCVKIRSRSKKKRKRLKVIKEMKKRKQVRLLKLRNWRGWFPCNWKRGSRMGMKILITMMNLLLRHFILIRKIGILESGPLKINLNIPWITGGFYGATFTA